MSECTNTAGIQHSHGIALQHDMFDLVIRMDGSIMQIRKEFIRRSKE